ncbi:aminotransferase class I/II-fold pyridoxal phosphate-dependent enzyme [Nocardioides sp. B-3]|uniref:aminotransferase class I/II-fold pyridoxal phosphate-dependent enzyme n=1 Tax=Nocardioides sp. B-3 TaxID=2895565 RepID=UPI00215277E8|nr:aminotransferase class I/II-fold pyridoxal phosphate-dependent enzyme [Nocardioides sp. B-3]UUZ61504.1 aminotransferase class I/II-fold pyridoxal phosphate-dependent enzyme [Nocardioides sp. B-3]
MRPASASPRCARAIARHQRRHYGIELDPDREVVVTTGATEGIAAALLGLIDPGDEVVVLEPYYDSYLAMIEMCGAVRRPVTLRAPSFRLDVEALHGAIGPRARAILLNSPHNPTGTVLTIEELQAVAVLAIEHDLIVITDEVYEHLVFDGHQHIPLATLPGMWERTLTLSSAGKSYSFTGWKVGWATGPSALVSAVLAAKQWLTFTSGSPLQPAVAHALDEEPGFPAELARSLQSRRDLLVAGLSAAGLDARVPEGTYFATTDISHPGWSDGREFCLALPERAGVVAIPNRAFYDDRDAGRHLVRWAFCKEPDLISAGVALLASVDLSR